MKTRPLIVSAAVAALAMTIPSALVFSQAPQSAGKIAQLIPAVDIDRGSQRLVAQAQAPVFWNDLVATQPLARARINLDDGSILNVGSNSSLRVIQHDASSQQTRLQLDLGRVRVKVVHLTHPGAKFQITTPVATAGVVGTDFYLQQGSGTPPAPRIDVGVLPFSAASSITLSDANTEALAKQLGDQLAQSGQIHSAMISPPAGAVAPLGPQAAAQSGKATNSTVVLVPVIEQAQAKEASHSFGGFGRFRVPGVSSTELKRVDAGVQLQVQIVRTSDGSVLKTIDASSKKGFNNVNVSGPGYSEDIGSADLNNPDFQKSPLGKTLAAAMSNLVAQVQSQASGVLQQAAAPPAGFDNTVATVLDFDGSVRFCNLKEQCVPVGPGMMSTVRAGQPPDPPHPADPAFVAQAQQSTDLSGAPSSVPATSAAAPSAGTPPFATESTGSCGAPSAPPPSAETASAFGSDYLLHSFAATMTVSTGTGGYVARMKYFATPGAIRMVPDAAGGQMAIIMRSDCHLLWTLMLQAHMYSELSLENIAKASTAGGGQENMANAARIPGAKIARQKLGTEQVGQYMCDKYHVTITTDKGTYSGTVWSARQLKGFPVKWLDDKTGTTVTYSDVDLSPQDPSLFMLPAGFRKLNMMSPPGRP